MGTPNNAIDFDKKAAPDQRLATWIFGSLLLAFYLLAFFFGPPVLANYKYNMLGVISALLGGLFAYFLTGQIVSTSKGFLPGGSQLAVRATGGIGLAVVLLVWWGHGAGPLQSSSQAAAQLQEKVQQAVSDAQASKTKVSAPGSSKSASTSAKTVVLSPTVQQLAKSLAESDPKYKNIEVLQTSKPISMETLTRISATLSQ